MIEYDGNGFINHIEYGVMKLGDEPALKPQFSLLTDEHFKKIDAQKKYSKDFIGHSNRYCGDSLVYSITRNGRKVGKKMS